MADSLELKILAATMDNLVTKLEGYGNELSEDHKAALHKIAHNFAFDAVYPDIGYKMAISLGTGLGKTQLLIVFLNTLHEMNVTYPVLVCVPNLVAMQELIEGLLEVHTLKDVGCKHSDSNNQQVRYASSRNEDLNKYKILVITHSRTNSSRADWESCLNYRGESRSVYYDEALKHGTIVAGRRYKLEDQVHNIRRHVSEEAKQYLNAVVTAMQEGATIPLTADENIKRNILNGIYKYQSGDKDLKFTLLQTMVSDKYDYLKVDKHDCFGFYNTLPAMRSLFVLDANHNYSLLAEHDELENLDISPFKTYENVLFKASSNRNGRVAVLENKQYYLDWAKEMYDEAIDQGHSPVVICFKDMVDDVKEQIDENYIQWGRHAGSNIYSDKDVIICIGIYRIRNEDAKGLITLHSNNINTSVENHNEVAEGEALLDLYQAVSRGRSRKVMVVDGKTVAQPSTIYLPGKLTPIQYNLLKEVMPGCKYQDDKFDAVIKDILDILKDKEGGYVSSAMLGKHVASFKALSVHKSKQCLNQMENYGWIRSGRGIRKKHGLNLMQISL